MSHDDLPLEEFLDAIASERVAPAGGTAAAVTGATGAALCEMVCVHTVRTAEHGESGAPSPEADGTTLPQNDGIDVGRSSELPELRAGLRRRRRKLLALGDQDANLVDELFGSDEGEGSTRLQRRAAGIPLAVSEAGLGVLTDAETVYHRGRSGVAADAKTGAYLADAAVRASLETVRINAAALADRSFASGLVERAGEVEQSAARIRSRLLDGD